MKRYVINKEDKSFINRETHFVELGLFDFWSLSMKAIKNNFPPLIKISNIDEAFNVIKIFIKECGNTLILDLPDGYSTNYITGIEIEQDTMRIIWYSANKIFEDSDVINDSFNEFRKSYIGENLEQQYGFTFDYLILTPAYILIYAEERAFPETIDTNEEHLEILTHPDLKIYEHTWGSYKVEPILQYRTRYYCNKGLVTVLYPKANRGSFRADEFFESL
ncbi:MAG: hypothetical protein IPM56_01715 [Ignavibacteriales bacterium]|nr:MAG: hypothetical protein IPM56_01715 [Ignavibacteriales bacterium]